MKNRLKLNIKMFFEEAILKLQLYFQKHFLIKRLENYKLNKL